MPFSHIRTLRLPSMRPMAVASDANTKDRERSVYSFVRLSRFLSSTGKCKSLPGAIVPQRGNELFLPRDDFGRRMMTDERCPLALAKDHVYHPSQRVQAAREQDNLVRFEPSRRLISKLQVLLDPRW